MSEPRRVDVVFADGCWLASVAPDFDGEFDGADLLLLIQAVQQALPTQPLVFVIDRATVEGNSDAQAQFLEASEKSDASVISSVQEF